MAAPQAGRLVAAVLRCYPARWRQRHAVEAAELATLLIADGRPVGSIAGSYLAGAAREWLMPPPGLRLRLRLAVCALLALTCSLGISAGLLASTAPAHAASTSHAHCRPSPRASTPQNRHQQTGTWHVRSC